MVRVLFLWFMLTTTRLQRFQNCYTWEPRLLSGIFLKKMPPLTNLKGAHEFWNRSNCQWVPRTSFPCAGWSFPNQGR